MKKSKFNETKIISILKQQESGRTVSDICREYGISQATFFNWKSKYGGMSVSSLKRLKELEQENMKLKKMYDETRLKNEALKDLIEKKL